MRWYEYQAVVTTHQRLQDSKGGRSRGIPQRCRATAERPGYYQSWSRDRPLSMVEDDLYDYLSRLWAMLSWGNKHYVVDKLIEPYGLEKVRQALANLVWGQEAG
jgi:hypothetical protein